MGSRLSRVIDHWMERSHPEGQKNSQEFVQNLPRHLGVGFGGNTPCVEVQSSQQSMIIDGGSGIRPLGYELMRGACGKGQGKLHLFFTHFHWDHLIGLPFFTPLFIPGNEIHFYAVQPELKSVIQSIFRKPYFPVEFSSLPATFHFHELKPRVKFMLDDLAITPYALDHPDPCWGYRVESHGKSYAHCVDTECTRKTTEQLGADLPLYQNADLMVFDSQYTLVEALEKVNWGHASASLGIDLAIREKVKQVIFMHYDPAAADEKIAQAEAQARRYHDQLAKDARANGHPVPELKWSFGHEGMTIEL
jgi:phosphoribosyl 1,2-cyclic phosphodiesterase